MAANPTSSKGPQQPPTTTNLSMSASHPQQIPQQAQIKIYRLQQNTDKLRLETHHLRERLQSEHEAVRALRAQHAAQLRAERVTARRRTVELETQVNSLKLPQHTPATNTSNYCEQCNRLKAEFQASLKQERLQFKQKEDLLKAQLRNQHPSNITPDPVNTPSVQCSQCILLKADHKKEISELKKKEDSLRLQLKHKLNETPPNIKCEQCIQTKSEYEAMLRKEKSEHQKREDLLKTQIEEKQKIINQSHTTSSSCEQCLKTKNEFTTELRKQQTEARKREELLEAQLKDKQKLLEDSLTSSTGSSNCEQCIRFKAEFDAELRKQQQTFRKKEDLLKTQLKDKDLLVSAKTSSSNLVASCEQCARLKAEYEAAYRKEKSDFKKRETLLKNQLTEMKKLLVGGGGGHDTSGSGCSSCSKLTKETFKLKELIKDFEEKLQKSIDADKLKANDLRTQHEKHVTELSRITKANKQEVHKLLEELKTKDRIIGQLRKSVGIAEIDQIQMRKLREEARKTDHPILLPLAATNTNKDSNLLTHLQQNELNKNKLTIKNKMVCGGASEELEPSLEEDIDSAVSSAPSSLSPQPCSPLNDDCHPLRMKPSPRNHRLLGDENAPTSLSPQPSEGYTTPPPGLWLINNEDICAKTDEEANELTMARRQVRELERALLVTRASKQSNHHVLILEDRLRQMEEREASLVRELSDLREQNELLEFRVLELAEGVDKTSLTNNQEDTDSLQHINLKEMSEKIDASTNLPLNDLEQLQFINHLNDDKVRNRLVQLVNKSTDAEDQKCVLQVLLLLNALEELKDHHENPFVTFTGDEEMTSTSLSPLAMGDQQQSIRPSNSNTRNCVERDRLVAKVLPFTGRSRSRSVDSEDERDLLNSSTSTTSATSHTHSHNHNQNQEEQITLSCGTQTDLILQQVDEQEQKDKSLNLTVEVQKLDKLRESIEVVGNRNGRLVVSNTSNATSNDSSSSSSTSSSICCCDLKKSLQRQLDYYQERLETLERKISVYESSGDAQVKQLTQRLNCEIRLEAQVKHLTATIEKLELDNCRLEEERCELEEAENDTRLRCQRLESELAQLERSRMHAKRRAKDARSQSAYWESMVSKYEERNYELEEKECELKHRLEILEKTAPQIMLLNMWQIMNADPKLDVVGKTVDRLKSSLHCSESRDNRSRSPPRRDKDKDTETCKCDSTAKLQEYIKNLEEDKGQLLSQKRYMENMVKDLEKQLQELQKPPSPCLPPTRTENAIDIASITSDDVQLMKVVQELKEREKDMFKRIENLEKREAAYMETLQQADEIWAEMESGYKQRICAAEQSESEMRDRLKRLQKRDLPRDTHEDDDYERELVNRAERLAKENNRLQAENKRLEKELKHYHDEIVFHKSETKVVVGSSCDKKKTGEVERRLKEENAALRETGNLQLAEIEALKLKVSRTANELVHLEVTNGELREEVDTLESKITEMARLANEKAAADECVIRGLTQELNDKDKELGAMKQSNAAAVAGERLGAALQGIKTCDICSSIVSPNLVETLDGVRTLCQLVASPNAPPVDDATAQVRRRRFGRWL